MGFSKILEDLAKIKVDIPAKSKSLTDALSFSGASLVDKRGKTPEQAQAASRTSHEVETGYDTFGKAYNFRGGDSV